MGKFANMDLGKIWVLAIFIGHFYNCADGSNNTTREANADFGNSVMNKEGLMTLEEKMAFDKFKRRVQPHIFGLDIMKQDLFYLRWIRAKHLDVNRAVEDYLRFKNYYTENRVEAMEQEDFSDIEQDFPVQMGIVDRQGRPAACCHIARGWDVRASLLQGKRQRMERYWAKIVFDMIKQLEEINKRDPNVNEIIMIVNAEGFNLIQQGCPRCVRSLLSMVELHERYIPGYLKEYIVVEAPTAWTIFYQAARVILSEESKNMVKLFDKNKNHWIPYVHKRVDPSQLPPYLGGTKTDFPNL